VLFAWYTSSLKDWLNRSLVPQFWARFNGDAEATDIAESDEQPPPHANVIAAIAFVHRHYLRLSTVTRRLGQLLEEEGEGGGEGGDEEDEEDEGGIHHTSGVGVAAAAAGQSQVQGEGHGVHPLLANLNELFATFIMRNVPGSFQTTMYTFFQTSFRAHHKRWRQARRAAKRAAREENEDEDEDEEEEEEASSSSSETDEDEDEDEDEEGEEEGEEGGDGMQLVDMDTGGEGASAVRSGAHACLSHLRSLGWLRWVEGIFSEMLYHEVDRRVKKKCEDVFDKPCLHKVGVGGCG
jgi:hypothetical protein